MITTQGGPPLHPPWLRREGPGAAERPLHPRGAAFSSAFSPPHVPPGAFQPPQPSQAQTCSPYPLFTQLAAGSCGPTPVGPWSPESIVRTSPAQSPATHSPHQGLQRWEPGTAPPIMAPSPQRPPEHALCPGLPSPSGVCHFLEETHVTHEEEVAGTLHRGVKGPEGARGG